MNKIKSYTLVVWTVQGNEGIEVLFIVQGLDVDVIRGSMVIVLEAAPLHLCQSAIAPNKHEQIINIRFLIGKKLPCHFKQIQVTW